MVYSVPVQSYNLIPFKPNGLWYSADAVWKKWCESEEFRTDQVVVETELEINLTKILVIDTIDKFDAFNEEFMIESYGQYEEINWSKVASKYGGIEIAPYQYKRRHGPFWYCGWDVASGCIWDADAVKIKESLHS